MDYLYHSANISDQVQELPIRITNSFPPRGLVAKILANEPNKAGTLYLYGNVTSSPLSQKYSHWNTNRTQPMDLKNTQNTGFSPPQTITEIKSLTRKTPRFYTVDSSILRNENVENLPTVDKLIANSEITGLKEVYQRVCKGNMESLKSLISKGQTYQQFAFLQTSYPSRYYQKGKRRTGGNLNVGGENNKINNQSLKEQSVLVPSPYFRRQRQTVRQSAPAILSPYVYSKSKETKSSTSPIEPTVINLNNKLPELPTNERLHERFKTRNICSVRKQRGDGKVAVFADRNTPLSAGSSASQDKKEESPDVNNRHILYGKTMVKNEKTVTKKPNS